MSDWISVEERSPEDGQRVDVWPWLNRSRLTDARYEDGVFKYFTSQKDGWVHLGGITYWMPIPEDPDE